MNNRNNTEEIDVFDLVKYLLTKWKQIVLSTIVGIVLFGTFSFFDGEVSTPMFNLVEREKILAYFEYQSLIESLKGDLNTEIDFNNKIELTNSIVDVQSKITGLGLNDTQLKKVESYNSSKQSIEEFIKSEELTTSSKKNSTLKQCFSGALVGCFLASAVYCFIYVLSGTIKTKREIKALRLFILGNIKDFEIIQSNLKEMTNNEVAYASTLDISMIPPNLACVGNPLKEVDGLKSIYNKDVVLIEKLKESNRQSIIDLKEFLEYSGFRIIGVILL